MPWPKGTPQSPALVARRAAALKKHGYDRRRDKLLRTRALKRGFCAADIRRLAENNGLTFAQALEALQ